MADEESGPKAVVQKAQGGRMSRIDEAESAAINPTPAPAPAAKPAAPAPAPAKPGVIDKVKSMFGFGHNPDNLLPANSQHAPGTR